MKRFYTRAKPSIAVDPLMHYKSLLAKSQILSHIPHETLIADQASTQVFFNKHYFPDPRYSIPRALTKIPAINIDGDRAVVFQNSIPFSNAPSFFEDIPDNHPEFLSPQERIISGKKIIYSKNFVFASGGYPHSNSKKPLEKQTHMGLFSLAGANFETSYLHYRRFMLDPVHTTIQSSNFDHLYDKLPTSFEESANILGNYDINNDITRLRIGLSLLTRSTSGQFYSSFNYASAVIFLSESYFRHQLEDVSLLLASVNEAAKQENKPAFLKATAVGMGFFSKINDQYDIHHVLYPYFLRAFKKLLNEHHYSWIKQIEFPIFNEQQEELFDAIFQDKTIGTITVQQAARDVLAFTEAETNNYFLCVINPTDTFSFVGNEWGYGSVEAMIGNNSSLRLTQVPLINPAILDPLRHIPVSINPISFSAEILDQRDANHCNPSL